MSENEPTRDPELEVFSTIGPALAMLDNDAQARVLRWALTRLDDKMRQEKWRSGEAARDMQHSSVHQESDVQMPGSHLKLMAVFLEQYAEEASNRSCNDFDLGKDGGLTSEECAAFLTWAAKTDPHLEIDVNLPMDPMLLGDDTIANLLARSLKKILG